MIDKMMESFEKLTLIENNTKNIDVRLSHLESELKEIKSIVTPSDLRDLKDSRIEQIRLKSVVDNIKEDLKKDLKPVSAISGGISATAVTAIIIGLIEYFSKGG